jgi:hypothetical protein
MQFDVSQSQVTLFRSKKAITNRKFGKDKLGTWVTWEWRDDNEGKRKVKPAHGTTRIYDIVGLRLSAVTYCKPNTTRHTVKKHPQRDTAHGTVNVERPWGTLFTAYLLFSLQTSFSRFGCTGSMRASSQRSRFLQQENIKWKKNNIIYDSWYRVGI